MHEQKPITTGFKFQPTISFDGVAIIVFCIVGAIAWGHLNAVVEQTVKDNEQNRKDIGDLRALVYQHENSIFNLKEKRVQ